jgi:hypothetical protein
MAPSHIPLWRCFSGTVPPKPPRNILHFLSQLKFDGEGETSASEHALNSGNFVVLTILLMEMSFAGCSLSLLQVGSRVGVRLCRSPLFTHGNNLCMNFCMLLRIMIMINCVKKFRA